MAVKGWYHADDDIPISDAATMHRSTSLDSLPVHFHLDLDAPHHFELLAKRFGHDVTVGDAIRALIEDGSSEGRVPDVSRADPNSGDPSQLARRLPSQEVER